MMARFKAWVGLKDVVKLKAIGPGHMQHCETGGYVRLEDYRKAVNKAIEEQRAVYAASKLVGELFRLIEDLGSTKLEMKARAILGKAGDE